MGIAPTVEKEVLLKRLQENKAKHRAVFEAAVQGWQAEVQAQLAAVAERVSQGRRRTVYISMPVPEDHTRDYDRAIDSVQLHVGATIDLTEADAAKYLMDDWGWKGEWSRSASSYANAAYVSTYGEDPNDGTMND